MVTHYINPSSASRHMTSIHQRGNFYGSRCQRQSNKDRSRKCLPLLQRPAPRCNNTRAEKFEQGSYKGQTPAEGRKLWPMFIPITPKAWLEGGRLQEKHFVTATCPLFMWRGGRAVACHGVATILGAIGEEGEEEAVCKGQSRLLRPSGVTANYPLWQQTPAHVLQSCPWGFYHALKVGRCGTLGC